MMPYPEMIKALEVKDELADWLQIERSAVWLNPETGRISVSVKQAKRIIARLQEGAVL